VVGVHAGRARESEDLPAVRPVTAGRWYRPRGWVVAVVVVGGAVRL